VAEPHIMPDIIYAKPQTLEREVGSIADQTRRWGFR
jgi:hypothetical protein